MCCLSSGCRLELAIAFQRRLMSRRAHSVQRFSASRSCSRCGVARASACIPDTESVAVDDGDWFLRNMTSIRRAWILFIINFTLVRNWSFRHLWASESFGCQFGPAKQSRKRYTTACAAIFSHMSAPIPVFIVNDHFIACIGLAMLINGEPSI